MRFRALFASGLVVVTTSAAFGQTAGMVSFQGLIRSTATGNPPITTPVSLEFRIFNADTGGAQVDMDGDGVLENTAAAPGAGTDVILVGPLTPNGGIVSTKFGPVSPKAFAGCTPGVAGCRWLEVTVVGSATPLSRIEMVTPPGAAEQVNRQTGNSAISVDAAGNVGINTTTPAYRLDVNDGWARIASPAQDAFLRLQTTGPGTFQQTVQFSDATSEWFVGNRYTQDLNGFGIGRTSEKNDLVIDSLGNVGIGTTPETRLKVNGILSFNRLPDDMPNAGFIGLEGIFPGRALSLVGSGTSPTNRRVHVFDMLTVGDTSGFQFNVNTVQNRVGIGTGSPSSTVSIRRDDDGKLLSFERLGLEKWWVGPIGTGDRGLAFANESDGDLLRLYLTETGNVGIGTASTSAKLHVAGSIFATGCTGCTSDARFKKNIATLTTALGKLLALRGVWFQWRDPKEHGDEARRQMGMIAQEVEKVIPEWVMTDKAGYRYLNTNGFPALAVEAIRELKTENDALKSKVSALEDRLARLEKAIGDKSSRFSHSEGRE